MISLVLAMVVYVRAFFLSRHRLALETVALRQQVAVFNSKQPRPRLARLDRLFWIAMRRLYSGWADALIRYKYTSLTERDTLQEQQEEDRHRGTLLDSVQFCSFVSNQRQAVCVAIAFVDESGCHDNRQGTFVVAGFLGSKQAWTDFEERWTRFIVEHPDIGSTHDHSFLRSRRCEKYAPQLVSIFESVPIHGVMALIDTADWREAKRRGLYDFGVGDSQWGFGFRVLLVKAIPVMRECYPGEQLAFIIENGHHNVGAAIEIVKRYSRPGKWSSYRLGGVDYQLKGSAGLEAAHFLAKCGYMNVANIFGGQFSSECSPLLCASILPRVELLEVTRHELELIATVENTFRFRD